MDTIWKFTLPIEDESVISLPRGAVILSIQEQSKTIGAPLSLWARVDTEAPFVDRKLVIAGTGHSLDGRLLPLDRHVATVQTASGLLVWHVFDAGEVSS